MEDGKTFLMRVELIQRICFVTHTCLKEHREGKVLVLTFVAPVHPPPEVVERLHEPATRFSFPASKEQLADTHKSVYAPRRIAA